MATSGQKVPFLVLFNDPDGHTLLVSLRECQSLKRTSFWAGAITLDVMPLLCQPEDFASQTPCAKACVWWCIAIMPVQKARAGRSPSPH